MALVDSTLGHDLGGVEVAVAEQIEECGRRGHRRLHAVATRGYTRGMKTAVSLPDDLFRAAERHAKRARKSRSQLYAEALAEYLARHAPDEVTEAMNRVVEQLGEAQADRFVAAAARRVLARTEW